MNIGDKISSVRAIKKIKVMVGYWYRMLHFLGDGFEIEI